MKYHCLTTLLATSLFTGVLSTVPAQAQAADSVVISRLTKIDEKVGSGKEALPGNTVFVHYTGWLHDPFASRERGTKFDSSVGQQAFSFTIGSGRVIKGWEQGVAGMKVGGKRTLIIPPELGYGAAGAGNGMIPPNAYLIFDIELLEVK